MKLLITGGAGFIGSNFVNYWVSHHGDDSIVVLDALTYAGNLENLEPVKDKITFIKGSINNQELVNELVEGVDIVIHFAAESHVDRSVLSPNAFIQTNIIGTYNILEAVKKHSKRLHHVSTDEVFGQIPLHSKHKFNEESPYNPRNPYSASKASSDHLVRSYFTTYNLPVTISNCSNNFGPYHFPEKLIPLAITNLVEGKKVPIYGKGDQVRDWLYVEDHCRAIEMIITGGKIGETYCVGGMTDEVTNLEVVKKIIKYLDKDYDTSIEFVTDRPGHDVKYSVDWSKIKTDLDWEPKYEFDHWLEKTIDWYKENESWWKNVKSGDYQKYYDINYTKRQL